MTESISLRDLLLHIAKTNDNIIITDGEWYTGCTFIDAEDLFIYSLNPKMLERNVKSYKYISKERIPFNIFDSGHPVMLIELESR